MNKYIGDLIRFLIAILPTIMAVNLLIHFYPHTGLGRIIALPIIYMLNSVIILVGIVVTRKYRQPCVTYCWIILIILTLIVTIFNYPQEYGNHVLMRIWGDLFH